MANNRPLMRVKEVAAYYNMSENALRIAIERRATWLPAVHRVGPRRIRFKPDEVEAAVRPAGH